MLTKDKDMLILLKRIRNFQHVVSVVLRKH